MHISEIATKPTLLNCSKSLECVIACLNFLLIAKLIVL